MFNASYFHLIVAASIATSIWLIAISVQKKGGVKHFSLVTGVSTFALTIVAGTLKYAVS